jgi:hypothetical protein
VAEVPMHRSESYRAQDAAVRDQLRRESEEILTEQLAADRNRRQGTPRSDVLVGGGLVLLTLFGAYRYSRTR